MIRRVVLNRFKDYERSSIIIFPKVSNALYYADQDRSIKLDRNLLSISSLVNADPATDNNERTPAQNSPNRGRDSSHHDKDGFRGQQSDNSRNSSHRLSTPSHVRDGRRSLSPSHRRKYGEGQTSRSESHRHVQTSRSESHRHVQTSQSESHRHVQTSQSESHRHVQTSRSASHRDVQTSRSASHRDVRSRPIILLDDRDRGSSSHRDDHGIRSLPHRDHVGRSAVLLDDRDSGPSYQDDQGIMSITHRDDVSRSTILLDDLSRSSHPDDRSIRSITHRDDRLSLLRGDRDSGLSSHREDHDSRSPQQGVQLQIHSRRLENSMSRSDNERRIMIKNLPLSVRASSLSNFVKYSKCISVHQDEFKANSLIGIIEFYTAKEASVFLKENNHMKLFKRILILEPYIDGIGIGPAVGRPIQDRSQSPLGSHQDLNNSPSHGISRRQSRSPLLRNQNPQTHSVPSNRYIDNFLHEEHEKLSDKQSTSQVKDIFNQFKDHAKKFATENPDSARALNELLVALGHTSKPNPDPSPLDDLQKAFIPQNELSAGDLDYMSPDSRRNFEREHITDRPKLAVLDQVEDLSQNLKILSQLSKLAKHLKTDRCDSDDAAAMALSTLEKLTSQTSSDPLPDDSRKSPSFPYENRDINDRFSQSPADNYHSSAETSSFQKCISFDYNHQKPGNEMKRMSSSPVPYRKEDRSQDRYDDSPDYKKRPREDYESDGPSGHRAGHDLRRRDDPRHHFDESLPNDWYEDRGWRGESRRPRDDLREYSPMDEFERDRFLHDNDGRLNRMREMRHGDGRYDDDDDTKLMPRYDRQFDPDDYEEEDDDDDDDDDDENKPIGWRYYSMGVKGGKWK